MFLPCPSKPQSMVLKSISLERMLRNTDSLISLILVSNLTTRLRLASKLKGP